MNIPSSMGRPCEYKPEYVEKIDEYLAQCIDEDYDWVKSNGDKSTSYEHRTNVKLPSKEDFASFIGVVDDTLDNWAKKQPEFLGALEKIIREQRKRLIARGLSGDYNSTIAKLILSSNHGMVEKQDVTSGGKELPSKLTIELVRCERTDTREVGSTP